MDFSDDNLIIIDNQIKLICKATYLRYYDTWVLMGGQLFSGEGKSTFG